MHRFMIPPQSIQGDKAVLVDPEARQIQTVLRLKVGQSIRVFDGTGREFEGEILSLSKGQVKIRLGSVSYPKTEADIPITLAQCLLKGEKMDWVIQKATEVGVHSITILTSSRTIPEIPIKKQKDRLDRWQKIAKEAAEQSGRVKIPHVSGPYEMYDWLDKQEGTLIIPWENETEPLSRVLRNISRGDLDPLTLIIGPEGGFSEEEVRQAVLHNARSVSLGPRILRAETAAIVAIALTLNLLTKE